MIQHVPHAGEVLYCNFEDLNPPEITKTRKVVVLSPRDRDSFPQTFLVVPVSKTFRSASPCHCEFRARSYHFFDERESVWALCDMVMCVARRRLNGFRINGRNVKTRISAADLTRVRQCVLGSIGMSHWREVEENARLTISLSTSELLTQTAKSLKLST